MKVLIVDDFASMRRIVKNLLRDLGFKNTKEAKDGEIALPMLKEGGYGFIITDSKMPKMGGVELLKAIRKDAKIKDIPVLLITQTENRKLLVEAAGEGLNGYIVKPFTEDVLEVKINKIFARLEKNRN